MDRGTTNLRRESGPTSIDSPYQPPPTVRTNYHVKPHVHDPSERADRRTSRHRVLGRARYQRGLALDARQGRTSLRLHREPRVSPTSPTTTRSRARRWPTAPRRRGSWTAGRSSSPRGWRHCSAAPSTSPRPASPTSTRRRSAALSPARCWCRPCARTTSTSGATAARSRATTSSASTATACWPTRRCASTSRGSIRPSSTSWAAARRCPSTWSGPGSPTR